ncbi:MAG: DUF3592 domain-containing protein [Parahaliea sp.]
MNRLLWPLGIIGTALLAIALWLYLGVNEFLAGAHQTDGEVIELVASHSDDSTVYRPRVKFLDHSGNEQTFQARIGSNPSLYQVGERVMIHYQHADLQNPDQLNVRINGFWSLWGMVSILAGLGVLLTLAPAIAGLVAVRSRQRVKRLMKTGRPVCARVSRIERDKHVTVNGRHPWRIYAKWHDLTSPDQVITFKSEVFWKNPEAITIGSKITVYIEHDKPSCHYIDLSPIMLNT